MPSSLERLFDRLAIQDVLALYARGVDRRDWDLVRCAYHADAYDDHGDFKGDVEGLINWVSERHQNVVQSMHFLGNCLIEFVDDDVALSETYFVALQRTEGEAAADLAVVGRESSGEFDASVDVDVMGRYIDRLERREGQWRIARRTVAFDGIRARPAARIALRPTWTLARRDESDPLVLARAEAGLGKRSTS